MNTVFKFYMQAWMMLGVVASFGVIVLLSELRGWSRGALALLFALLALSTLLYPYYGFAERTRGAGWESLTFQSGQALSDDEWAAVRWLQGAPLAPLVEAVGGSYSAYGRYVVHSGQMSVLGWPGHENQWRAGSVNFGPRQVDIEALYTIDDWLLASQILARYEARYVVVGALEHASYTVSEAKFQEHLEVGFSNPAVTIYLVP